MKKATPPRIEKFPAVKQRRLDRLLEKNSVGTITANEKAKLKELVAEAEQRMIANAKRLADFAESESKPPSAGAVPVTVWIQPERTRQ